jgi:Ino eighty subunit 2
MGDGFDESNNQTLAPPTMYRWISTIKRPALEILANKKPKEGTEGAEDQGGSESGETPQMLLTFSVPLSALPQDTVPSKAVTTPPVQPRQCDFEGCTSVRKYRLVKDWQRGACGMDHHKAIEARLSIGN